MVAQVFIGLYMSPWAAVVAAILIAALFVLALRGDPTENGAAATGALVRLSGFLERFGRHDRGEDRPPKKRRK